jgi:uncharacterized membrane protein
MNWLTAALIAVLFVGFSDIFRKFASVSRDPYFITLIFHFVAFITAYVLFFMNRKYVIDSKEIAFASISGILIAVATVYSIKAMGNGPGVSTVMPIIRIGGLMITVVIGILILKEKVTVHLALGMLFSCIGIYLLSMQTTR